MASRRSQLHPLFSTAWYEKGAVRTDAYLRTLLELRASLSRRELTLLLQNNVAFPREYRIAPALREFAYDIAQSRLPTDEWLARHPTEARIVQHTLDQYWDETGDKLRKQGGFPFVSSPQVMRDRQRRRASGCSTVGYNPEPELRGAAPRSVITRHTRRMPAWIAEGGSHTTSTSRYGELYTTCRKGQLRTVIR